MPTLNCFDGIYIKMLPKDHEPPHVHVECGNRRSCFKISDGEILNNLMMDAELYKVVPLEDAVLKIKFLNGVVKLYDIKQLSGEKPFLDGKSIFDILGDDSELFSKVYITLDRLGVVWNDDIDLAAEELWNNGEVIDASEWSEEDERKANPTPVNYYVEQTAKKLGIEVFVDLFYTDQLQAPETVRVRTQGCEATVDLNTRAIVDGEIPDNVFPYVMRWLRRNRRHLNKFWKQRMMEKPT